MNKLKFKQTNDTCPETYVILIADTKEKVGSLSLRFGKLRATNRIGHVIYEASVGDEWTGRFTDYEEQQKHFAAIEEKILEWLEKRG